VTQNDIDYIDNPPGFILLKPNIFLRNDKNSHSNRIKDIRCCR